MRNEYYKYMIENSPIGFAYHRIICDQDGIPCDYEFIEVNEAFEIITGVKAKSKNIVGKRVTELIPGIKESNFDWIGTYGEIALSAGSVEFEEYSSILGHWYKVYVVSTERGYFATWFTDITQEKRNLEERTSLLTAINDMIFELDDMYIFRSVITSDDSALFLPREDFIDKRVDMVFSKELASQFIDEFEKAKESGNKIYKRYDLMINNEQKWFEAKISFKEDIFNKWKYIVSVRDTSVEKKNEEDLANKTAELERFFDINLDLLCIADIEGNFIRVNKAWENILGYPAEELEKRKFLDFIHPDDMEATLESISRLADNQQVLYFTNRYKSKDESYRFIEWCSQPYGDLIYAAARDITERKMIEEALSLSEERFIYAMRGTKSGLWDWDIKEGTVFYSPQWKSMLGYDEDDIDNTINSWKELWHPDEREENEQIINNYMSGKTKVYEVEHRLRCKDGKWRWILTRGELLRDDAGEPYRWTGTNIDITDLKEAQQKISYLSFHDQLTGLYNRRFYEEELSRIDTERNLPLSLVMADINGLKLANDAFGHLTGDKLLRKAADAMKQVCRSDEIISRIGGDEFVIILPKTDIYGAKSFVERLTAVVESMQVDILDMSLSFGWATKIFAVESIDDIFNRAEEIMYQSKLYKSPKFKEKTIKKIMKVLCERIHEEKRHSEAVSKICELIGKKLDFDEEELKEIKIAGLYHDIGKINLDENILNKSGTLTELEWVEIKRHPITAYHILNSLNDMAVIAKFILYHHERWDGSGYPDGLAGSKIPLESRIIAVADAYDAMTCKRSYKKTFSKDEAIIEIEKHAGTQFDADIVKKFIEAIKNDS